MNRQELERTLSNGTLPSSMALYGESHFLIDLYAKNIHRYKDASLLSLYYDEYDFQLAKAHLSQGSLFGDQNVLLIKHDKKIPKSELDILIELVNKNPNNYFLYCYYGDDMKSVDTPFKGKNSAFVRFYNPFPSEAKAMLIQEARRLNMRIDQQALMRLLDIHHNDLALSFKDLEKLSITNKPLTLRDIDEQIYGLSEIKLDQFYINVIEKKEYLSSLTHLLESGEEPIKLLTGLSNMIAQLYLFHITIKLNGNADSSVVLGYKLPSMLEKERANLSIKIAFDKYKKLIDYLIDIELKMKSAGGPDQESLLLSALLRVNKIL